MRDWSLAGRFSQIAPKSIRAAKRKYDYMKRRFKGRCAFVGLANESIAVSQKMQENYRLIQSDLCQIG